MHRRIVRASLAAAALAIAFPFAASASPPAEMDANPEVQYYPCPQTWDVIASWSVASAGISWKVNFGDGSGWSQSYPISKTSISWTYHPHTNCYSWTQTFRATDSLGGTATDYTRLTYSL